MIGRQLYAIARKMLIDFESTAEIEHHLKKGEIREEIVIKEFLKKCLPPRFGVTSGIVFDAFGRQSRQIDVIIFDKDNTMPLFTNNTSAVECQNLIPIENVYAVIEVKSKLTNEAIDDGIEKYMSVVTLSKHEISSNPVFHTISACYAPAGFVFAYSSDARLESLAEYIQMQRKALNGLCHPSAFLVLDKGIVHYAEKKNVRKYSPFPNAVDVTEVITETKEKGDVLLNFTLVLNHVLNSIVLHLPNLETYLKNYGEHYNSSIGIPYNLQPEDLSIVMEDGSKFNNIKALATIVREQHKQKDETVTFTPKESEISDKL